MLLLDLIHDKLVVDIPLAAEQLQFEVEHILLVAFIFLIIFFNLELIF
jgi:hypothetical protein